jgi:carbon monoxide dehydrogenase subunit G
MKTAWDAFPLGAQSASSVSSMDFSGRYTIPAPPGAVWAALHDPTILAASIPGCEGVERVDAHNFKARSTLAVGPVKARFESEARLDALAPPTGFTHALTLAGRSQGGPAGFVSYESQVRLAVDKSGTVLVYDAKATLGGRLAQIGRPAIEDAAKTRADEFFATFASLMQAPPPETPYTAAQHGRNETRHGEEGLAPQIWIAGLIVIVIILLIFFGVVL